MGFFWRIVLGIGIPIAGFFVVKKSEDLVGFVGKSWWAERKLGTYGGTGTVIKTVGIIANFVGFSILVGLHTALLEFIVGIFIPQTR